MNRRQPVRLSNQSENVTLPRFRLDKFQFESQGGRQRLYAGERRIAAIFDIAHGIGIRNPCRLGRGVPSPPASLASRANLRWDAGGRRLSSRSGGRRKFLHDLLANRLMAPPLFLCRGPRDSSKTFLGHLAPLR